MITPTPQPVAFSLDDGMLKSPYPYFGGKRRIADTVWAAFGHDVPNYIEPFFGSGAVLLARKNWQNRTETANELNPYIVNFWRAIARDPEGVAHYANWPIFETDLHSRHIWLVNQDDFKEKMYADPDYYDAKIAGWWVWGTCAWIGSGWCETKNPPASLPSIGGSDRGVHRKSLGRLHRPMPHLSSGGQGVHRTTITRKGVSNSDDDRGGGLSHKLPQLYTSNGVHRKSLVDVVEDEAGYDEGGDGGLSRKIPELYSNRGVHRSSNTNLLEYFDRLCERTRHLRITCGSWEAGWERILGPSVTTKQGMTAVFLDPPYIEGSEYYNGTKTNVTHDVLRWCKENWDNPLLRIALCGYEGEMDVPAEWQVVSWQQNAGYNSHAKENNKRERVWLSPACLPLVSERPKQLSLLDSLFAEPPAPAETGEGAAEDRDGQELELGYYKDDGYEEEGGTK